MNTSGIMQTIIETSVDPKQAIATMAAVAKDAGEWAKAHETRVTRAIKTKWLTGTSVSLHREGTEYWAGTFDLLLGTLVSSWLIDPAFSGMEVRILAHADRQTSDISSYVGIIEACDDDNITFYDGVTVARENVIAVGA